MIKGVFTCFLILATTVSLSGQAHRLQTEVVRIPIVYKGKTVNAKKLTVSSYIPMPIEKAWANVKTPELLVFVAKGYVKFKPVNNLNLPKYWPLNDTVKAKYRIFGLLPFGGVRHLYIETICDTTKVIQTREWDNRAKVWDHKVCMASPTDSTTHYTDSIVIYGGFLTGIITSFAKKFYKHRQKRWQLVAQRKLDFS